jgi:glycosyltransferase involved in cell wall biosynthesis
LSWFIPRSSFTVLPNPIDSELFRPALVEASPKNEILFIGRFDYNKGVFDLTEAVRPLLKKYPWLAVRFIGMDTRAPKHLKKYGNMASDVISSLIPAEDRNRIIFTGHVPVTQTILYQQKAICTVMPTRGFESFSYIVVEAMSCGCPVIATDCGGPTEIITDGVDGLLVAPGDSGALGDAMERLIEDKQLRENMAIQARSTVEHKYSTNVVVPRIIQLYENVISKFKTVAENCDTELCRKQTTNMSRWFRLSSGCETQPGN